MSSWRGNDGWGGGASNERGEMRRQDGLLPPGTFRAKTALVTNLRRMVRAAEGGALGSQTVLFLQAGGESGKEKKAVRRVGEIAESCSTKYYVLAGLWISLRRGLTFLNPQPSSRTQIFKSGKYVSNS